MRHESPVALHDDLAAARRIARRFLRLQSRHPLWLAKVRRANRWLAAEWLALIGLTYVLVYAIDPWPLKLALLIPWSVFCALALDNIVHYSNHWPPFRREFVNVAWRAFGVLLCWSPLEVRYHHWQHHRSYDLADDPQHTLRHLAGQSFWPRTLGFAGYLALQSLRSVWSFLPWTPLPDYIRRLRQCRPAHYWEIVITRWACLPWLLVLLCVAPWDTSLYLLPATFLVAPCASFLMNLTDHAPADLSHPLRQATYFKPRNGWERLLSAINHHTAATHLTHHLFPQVHFTFLVKLQQRLLGYYQRHDSPRSLLLNTALLGNPWALLHVCRALLRPARGTTGRESRALRQSEPPPAGEPVNAGVDRGGS